MSASADRSDVKAVDLLHLTDPHLTSLAGARWWQLLNKRILGYLSWRTRRRHIHRAERLADIPAAVAPGGVDQVLLTGDLTHIGLKDEFRQAREWLDDFDDPDHCFVIAGNHETYAPARWSDTLGRWSDYLAGDNGAAPGGRADYPVVRRIGTVAAIGVDSAVPTAPFRATGRVGARQRRRLGRWLDELGRAGYCRVVCVHHPVLAGAVSRRKRLVDGPALRAVLAEHGAEVVLHGHAHRWFVDAMDTADGDCLVVGGPSTTADHGGFGADHEAGFAHLRIDGKPGTWRVRLVRYSYDADRYRELDRLDHHCGR